MESSAKGPGRMLQTASMISGKLLALAGTFTLPLFLTRFLSREEYGIFSQYFVVVFFCIEFFSFSLDSNLYFFYPGSDEKTRKKLVVNTFIMLLLAVVVVTGLIFIPGAGRYLMGEGELAQYRTYLLAGVILMMAPRMTEPLYVLRKDVLTSLIYPPAEILVRLSLVIGSVLIVPGLDSVFSAILLAGAAGFMFVLIYAFKGIGLKDVKDALADRGLAREQLRYSLPFGTATSLNIFYQRFDKIICISFLAASDYALYAIAFYGIPGIMQVYDSLSQVYLVRMIGKFKENRIDEIRDIYQGLVSSTFSFTVPLLAIVMLYAGKIIVFLFTENYAGAVPLFRMYLLSFPVVMLGSGLILRATGNTRYTLRSYLLSGMVIVPATWLLIKNFGMWGAMTGSLISISLPKILNLVTEIRLLQTNAASFFPWRNIGQIMLISLVAIIPFALIEYLFDYGTFLTALLGVTYLLIVAALEIRLDLFPVEPSVIRERLGYPARRLFHFYKRI